MPAAVLGPAAGVAAWQASSRSGSSCSQVRSGGRAVVELKGGMRQEVQRVRSGPKPESDAVRNAKQGSTTCAYGRPLWLFVV